MTASGRRPETFPGSTYRWPLREIARRGALLAAFAALLGMAGCTFCTTNDDGERVCLSDYGKDRPY